MFKLYAQLILFSSVFLNYVNTAKAVEENFPYGDLWGYQLTQEEYRQRLGNILKSVINDSVDPCDDFYEYSCGKWSGGSTMYGAVMHLGNLWPEIFAKYTNKSIPYQPRFVFPEELKKNDGSMPSTITEYEQMVVDFYESCVNNDPLPEAKLAQDLKSFFKNATRSKQNSDFNWVNFSAYIRTFGANVFITEKLIIYQNKVQFSPDEFEERNEIRNISEFGCNIYDRDLIREVLEFVNSDDSRDMSDIIDDIIEVDEQLETLTKRFPNKDKDDDGTEYTLKKLSKLVTGINWTEYLAVILGKQPDKSEEVLVKSENYFKALVKLVKKLTIKKVRTYSGFRLGYFLYKRTHLNTDEQCAKVALEALRIPANALYTRAYFGTDIVDEITHLFDEIRSQFLEYIKDADWIMKRSKKAFSKVATQAEVKIGYDANFERKLLTGIKGEYTLDPNEYLANLIALLKLTAADPLKASEAMMMSFPAEINAYYDPDYNQLIIPAAILNPPFYHINQPAWAKYSAIGSIIGHELIHSFDFSSFLRGKMNRLHKNIDLLTVTNYFQKTVCLARQYNGYGFTQAESSEHIDGVQTISENMADNVGTNLAFQIYEKWLMEHEEKLAEETIEGLNLTPQQLFFVQYAQVWCDDDNTIDNDDNHSPANYRVLGTVMNSDHFAKTFNCPTGSKMNQEKKCRY